MSTERVEPKYKNNNFTVLGIKTIRGEDRLISLRSIKSIIDISSIFRPHLIINLSNLSITFKSVLHTFYNSNSLELNYF